MDKDMRMGQRLSPQQQPRDLLEKRPCRKEILFGVLSGLFSAEAELEHILDRLERAQ